MSDEFVVDDVAGKSDTAAWVNPDVKDCPVIPLGFVGRDIVFALPEGEIRQEPAGRIAQMLRTDIYASFEGAAFLGNWRGGEDDKIDLQSAARWLVRQCRARGIWDGSRAQRGYGVWATEAGPVVHVGNAVGAWPFGEGDWRTVTDVLREDASGPIWLLRPPTPRPSAAAKAGEVEAFRKILDKWNFAPVEGSRGMSGADVLIGHLGVLLLGAWSRFRPHVNVSGGRGTGKTTLSMLMQAAASANAGDLLDTFTEAGVRQQLSGEARGLFLDEAEPSTDGTPGPVERAMELLRRMATGEGSAGRQGSIRGGPAATSALGCAYLASIYPLAINDAMASRLVEVRLRPLGAAKGGDDDALRDAIEAARAMSPRLLARAMREAKRFRADVSLLKEALGELRHDPRTADLVAALAAGRRLLLHDQALTLDEACAEARDWAWLSTSREQTSSAQNPGHACLAKLLSINSGQHVRDRFYSIGELVQEEVEARGAHDKVLKSWGLKVENGHGQAERVGPWLIVSNNHPALQRAMTGSNANWRGVLEHLADLGPAFAPQPMPGAVRFGLGHQSRALAVPLTPWLDRPVAVGADPQASSPFDPPDWGSDGPASRDSSRSASREESHD